MDSKKRSKLFVKVIVVLLSFISTFSLWNKQNTFAQALVENFGNIGTVKTIEGQVTNIINVPIFETIIVITNLQNDQDYTISVDKNGKFRRKGLSAGLYKISVRASGFDLVEFNVNINKKTPSKMKQYMGIKLAAGCTGGGNKVNLVDK